MQDQVTSSSSGEPQDRSPERFFQLFTRMEKYLYFDTKWKLLDKSTPGDILLEVAMRADDSDEYQFAHNIFCGLPKRSRRVYAYHYGGGLSVSEIARMCNTAEDKIKSSLKRIRNLLGSKETHAMMIRFVKIEFQFAEERCREMAIKLMLEHGVDPAAVYGATQAVDPSVMPALMDVTSQSLNQIAENLGIEAPQMVETATVGTVAAATAVTTAVTNKSFSAFLMFFAMPVIWMLALIVSGKILGAAIIKSTPSLNMRRWLVKQMFVGYCLTLAIPISLFVYVSIFWFIVKPDDQTLFFGNSMYFGAVIVSCVLYPICIHLRYKSVKASDAGKEMMDFPQLERFIHWGMKVLSIILLVSFPAIVGEYVVSDFMHLFKTEQYDHVMIVLCTICLLMAVIYSVHQGMNQFFSYYLTLCHNKTSVRSKSSCNIDSILDNIKKEFHYVAFFAMGPIGMNFVHILGFRPHTWGSLMELVAFIPWWCLILWQNIRQPKNRLYWLAGSLAIQVGIMAYLRFAVYG